MSLFRKRAQTADSLIPPRSSTSAGSVSVTADTAMRHSAVWACLRLRADLISTLPVDVFRRVDGVQVEVPKPPLLTSPDGGPWTPWAYASQFDLDRYGNAFGIVTARDGAGFPARVELVDAGLVTVRSDGGRAVGYRVAGTEYAPEQVWHERQYVVPGLAVGLSPLAYAAWSVGGYLSAQQFALDFFASGAAPTGHLKNTARIVDPDQADRYKARFKAAVANRDVLVTGNDWDFTMAEVPASTTQFLETMKYGVADVARFFGVPADLIDAEVSTGSITYANVTQRNLQLLVMNLGPAIVRREEALTAALPRPRFVKLNTDALLRMDPASRSQMLLAQVAGRVLAPSEARALDNRAPFTPEQIAEFDAVFGRTPAPVATQAAAPVVNVDARTEVGPTTVRAGDVTVPEREVRVDNHVDATTAVLEGAVQVSTPVDARTEVTVPERSVEVTVPPAPAPGPVRKRIETDDAGRITAVIEERA